MLLWKSFLVLFGGTAAGSSAAAGMLPPAKLTTGTVQGCRPGYPRLL